MPYLSSLSPYLPIMSLCLAGLLCFRTFLSYKVFLPRTLVATFCLSDLPIYCICLHTYCVFLPCLPTANASSSSLTYIMSLSANLPIVFPYLASLPTYTPSPRLTFPNLRSCLACLPGRTISLSYFLICLHTQFYSLSSHFARLQCFPALLAWLTTHRFHALPICRAIQPCLPTYLWISVFWLTYLLSSYFASMLTSPFIVLCLRVIYTHSPSAYLHQAKRSRQGEDEGEEGKIYVLPSYIHHH